MRSLLNSTWILVLILAGCATGLEHLEREVMISSGRVYRLEGEGGSAVLVTPSLNGRILTSRVGNTESIGFVSIDDIARGNVSTRFNNYGGQDRLWIGPEAGTHGFFFKPGNQINRELWRVPSHLNTGEMMVESATDSTLNMNRNIALLNYSGLVFKLRVEREVGLIPSAKLSEELGVTLPTGMSYVGSYSRNTVTNIGDASWSRETGLPCIWILGQYNAGPRTTVLAPFKPATEEGEEGSPINDDYFGKISAETPGRIHVLENAVVFRADARHEGKLGISPTRSRGLAASFDPDKNLLIIVKFDLHPEDELFASFTWEYPNPRPYQGDQLQIYNADSETHAFYEMESTSPCRELAPGQKLRHRHASFAFQGDRDALRELAVKVLGVKFEAFKMAKAKPQTPK